MDPKQDLQQCINLCRKDAEEFRRLAQTESSQTCRQILMDAAHHLDVALAECNYTMNNL
ncbi:MAG: hypothetical protein ACM3WV_08340 [Bacillota bacterium]